MLTVFSILGFGVGCVCILKSGKGGKNQVLVEPRDLFMLFNARNLRWFSSPEEGRSNL